MNAHVGVMVYQVLLVQGLCNLLTFTNVEMVIALLLTYLRSVAYC